MAQSALKIEHRMVLSAIICNLLTLPITSLAEKPKTQPMQWQEEKEFTYAGKCFDGKKYWLFASEAIEDAHVIPFFKYKGPAGEGIVRTDTPPKVMVQRICREQADIVANL